MKKVTQILICILIITAIVAGVLINQNSKNILPQNSPFEEGKIEISFRENTTLKQLKVLFDKFQIDKSKIMYGYRSGDNEFLGEDRIVKWVRIDVPVGTEKDYISKLKLDPIIKDINQPHKVLLQ